MATVSFTEQSKGNTGMPRYSEHVPTDVLPATGESVLAKAQAAFAALREAERSENAHVQQLSRFLDLQVPMTANELLQFSQEVQKNSADNGELSPEQLEEVRRMAARTVAFIQMSNRPERAAITGEPEATGGDFIPPAWLKEALRYLSRSAAVLFVVIVTMACTVQPAGASSESAGAIIEYLEKEVEALPITPTPTKTPVPPATPRPTAVATATEKAPLPTVTPEPEPAVKVEFDIWKSIATGPVNVQSVKSSEDNVPIGEIAVGEEVKVLADDGSGWLEIEWIGGSAFTAKQFFEQQPPAELVGQAKTGGAVPDSKPSQVVTATVTSSEVGSPTTPESLVEKQPTIEDLAKLVETEFGGNHPFEFIPSVDEIEGQLRINSAFLAMILHQTGMTLEELREAIENKKPVTIEIPAEANSGPVGRAPSVLGSPEEIAIIPANGMEATEFHTEEAAREYIQSLGLHFVYDPAQRIADREGNIVGSAVCVSSSDTFAYIFEVNGKFSVVLGFSEKFVRAYKLYAVLALVATVDIVQDEIGPDGKPTYHFTDLAKALASTPGSDQDGINVLGNIVSFPDPLKPIKFFWLNPADSPTGNEPQGSNLLQ